MTDRTVDVWGERTPHAPATPWAERVDLHLLDGIREGDVERWAPSACLLCSNGCGLDIAVSGGRMVGVRGRAADRVNRGRLGPKGLYGWQGQQSGRLTRPLVRTNGELAPTTWDDAMDLVARRSRTLLSAAGPGSHAFYTSGQLMLEEYYTLALIAKGGIGTPHTDGNTRLCTATAAAALKETFGSDGQPGTYDDIEHCDALFAYGHNVPETQTVLWARMLDRLDGPDPPRLVCVDPRRTEVARRADVHLPVRPGTNLALMNSLLNEILENGRHDAEWITGHTVGFDRLRRLVENYPAERAAAICQVPAQDIRRAALIFGRAERVLSTVLQGFYQSHQATAAACQVNNLHLLRAMIGRPGAGVLQMNGQPTAQNARECGADGDLPGFRNWANPAHVRELAHLWDVDESTIPHDGPPTHAMRIFRLVESGDVRFLWIAGTNPAVSLPELARVRQTLGNDCFIVVSDGYHTETTEFADVVLPAALWGEKTGTYTNADRTVHLSEQAVPPPGDARSDFTIWLDYARRLDLRTRSGRPLPWWSSPEEAFEEWKRCSAGRPCDYNGLSYPVLRNGNGIQWPDGTSRLYSDGVFVTATDDCETYGHDLATGEPVGEEAHRELAPAGRAILKTTDYSPAPSEPDDEYPFLLTTGRTVHHFHTRTKTGRADRLSHAAPRAWVEMSSIDAARLELSDGERVLIETPRGSLELPVRLGPIAERTLFIPFHYGNSLPGDTSWQAANELTMPAWDPVSKQPMFKGCAARVTVRG